MSTETCSTPTRGMLRRAWDGQDIGGEFFKPAQGLLPVMTEGVPRAWMWPHITLTPVSIEPREPVRHGSSSNCLAVQNRVLCMAGVQGDFTLHSARFYIPGVAGQLGMTLEQRRTLGHWGPRSSMPVQYDQARCCTELRMKAYLWNPLASGCRPAGALEIPQTAEVKKVAAERVERTERLRAMREEAKLRQPWQCLTCASCGVQGCAGVCPGCGGMLCDFCISDHYWDRVRDGRCGPLGQARQQGKTNRPDCFKTGEEERAGGEKAEIVVNHKS